MFEKIWGWCKKLWQREFSPKPQIAEPKPEIDPLSDAGYESLFIELLDGVHPGWERSPSN